MGDGAWSGQPVYTVPVTRRSRWVLPLVIGVALLLVVAGGVFAWRFVTRPGTVPPVSTRPCVTGRVDRTYYSFTVPSGWCHDGEGEGGTSVTTRTGSSIDVVEAGPPVDAKKICIGIAERIGTPTRLPDVEWGGQVGEAIQVEIAGEPNQYMYCVTVKGQFYLVQGSVRVGQFASDPLETAHDGMKVLIASWVWK